jgi:hypothetical protein
MKKQMTARFPATTPWYSISLTVGTYLGAQMKEK